MAPLKFLPILCLVTACAPSPLYVQKVRTGGTVGEIPRDGSGEPVWSAIRPAIPVAAPPAGLTVNPGVPVTAPPPASYVPPAAAAPRGNDWVAQTEVPRSAVRTTIRHRTTVVRHHHARHARAGRRGVIIHRRTTTLSVTR